MTLRLGARPLKLEEVWEVALSGRKVELAPVAVKRISRSRNYLQKRIQSGETIYGVNTGFGSLSSVRIPEEEIEALQVNLLRSHAAGIGDPISDESVRAMLLLRANTLAQGYSGVRPELVEQILLLLNRRVHPIVPEQGSVGASGDLAPLAHLALPLIGEGRVRYRGRVMAAATALRSAKIKPIRLSAKEGLALINGTQFMTAIGSLAALEAENLLSIADLSGAMSLEAVRGTVDAFDSEIHRVRPHPGQIASAAHLRKILSSGGASEISKSHEDCGEVQDPYSFRCMPQVHGAARDAFAFVRTVLERELNAVTDNPLVFPEKNKILSGGNFHGQYVAMAMDFLSIAVAELASISEQRLEKLINPAFSKLPAFLTDRGGIHSGFMIVQVAAASIVSENKTLCHPASVDSIPTSADKEDHVSMGAWAARKAARVVANTRRVLAMELAAAAQGLDLLRPLRSSPRIERLHQTIRKRVKKVNGDRVFHEDIAALEEMILKGSLV